MKHSILPLCIVILSTLAGCELRTDVVSDYRPVDTKEWRANDKVEFEVGPLTDDADYLLTLHLRSTAANAYPYKDLYLEVRQLWSEDGDAADDSLCTVYAQVCRLCSEKIAANDRRAARHDSTALAESDSLRLLVDSLHAATRRLQAQADRLQALTDSIVAARRSRVVVDTARCRLVEGADRATGITVLQYSMQIGHRHLRSGQKGRITVRHIMNDEGLRGISDIGFTLERQ